MSKFKRRDELEASKGRDVARLAKESAGSTVYTLMVVSGLVLLVILSLRFNYEQDFSRQKSNRLTPETVEALQNMDQPVKIYGLYRKQLTVQRDTLWDLVQKFQRVHPALDFEFIDPIQRPGILEQLNVQLEGEDNSQGAIVVEQGQRRIKFSGAEEEALLNALLNVGSEEQFTVGFGVGAGMRDPGSTANNGLQRFAESLEREYYEVITVPLDNEYPSRLDVLVVSGPRIPFSPTQQERLARWLESGGRLLAMLEPGDPSNLDEVLDRWGLKIERRVIVDQRENNNDQQDFIRVNSYTNHEIVESFDKNFSLGLPVASAVTSYEPGDPLIFHSTLASSSGFSFALDEQGELIPGPLAVAAASWREDTQEGGVPLTRLVLIGDADIASNAYLAKDSNRNFLLNAVAWLTRNQDKIVVRRDTLPDQKFRNDSFRDLIFYDAAIWGGSILITLAGFLVAWRRKGK